MGLKVRGFRVVFVIFKWPLCFEKLSSFLRSRLLDLCLKLPVYLYLRDNAPFSYTKDRPRVSNHFNTAHFFTQFNGAHLGVKPSKQSLLQHFLNIVTKHTLLPHVWQWMCYNQPKRLFDFQVMIFVTVTRTNEYHLFADLITFNSASVLKHCNVIKVSPGL